MKLSLNWVKQYTQVNLPVDELVKKIGAQLGEVEGVENLAPKYEGAVIARVVSCENHPNADRLHVCMIDDGGKTENVARNEQGLVQVVCGAPNVATGVTVVWLPPGVTVPESYGKDAFVLEARELRGIVSNGMLASAKELAFGDSHDGLLLVDDDKQPGTSFADAYGLNDTIIDIENKMFTHRPDLFGQLGLAREVAGIQGQQFTSPDWYGIQPENSGSGLELNVINEIPTLVPRFMAVAVKDVTIKASPLWLQAELLRVGAKPINNVVDATNYIMLLTAQPTHAYDYDKIRGATLVARMAKPSEQLPLLNGKTYELDVNDIVIADAEGPVGLAGIMGGGNSEVSAGTKNLLLECGTFDMYEVRRASMRHGVFTDALTRFNKGQSPLQNATVLRLLVESIFDVAGGELASAIHDQSTVEGREWVHPPVPISTEFINTRLGLDLSAGDVKHLLENVEFTVTQDSENLSITAPFWRTDVELREDVVEEVGRLYGYDKLPLELPVRSVRPVAKDALMQTKKKIRDVLSRAGANEVLTYSFVHGNVLEKSKQDKSVAFQVANALSPDLQYYRLSLTPSILDKVHMNIKAGYDEFALFELNKVHYFGEWDEHEPTIPNEDNHVAFVIAASDKLRMEGAAYYHARTYLDSINEGLASTLVPMTEYDIESDKWGQQLTSPYDPKRSALIIRNGMVYGVVGEFKATVRRAFKLPKYTAGFEIHMDALSVGARSYQALPRFPAVWQDMTLKVASDKSFGMIHEVVDSLFAATAPDKSLIELEPLGIYRSEADVTHNNVSFRLKVTSYEKTLTDTEVEKLLEGIAAHAKEQLGAERV